MTERADRAAGKDARLNVRATAGQLNLLRQAAQAQGRSLSDFVLTAATERAEEILVERRYFVASPEAWDAFMATLNDPLDPAPALVRLFREAERR